MFSLNSKIISTEQNGTGWKTNPVTNISLSIPKASAHGGTTDDFFTRRFPSSPFSAILLVSRIPRLPSLILSSNLFLCLPLFLHPWTVPCMIVLARLNELVICPPYQFSLHCLTNVRRSVYGLIAFWIWFFHPLSGCDHDSWCQIVSDGSSMTYFNIVLLF